MASQAAAFRAVLEAAPRERDIQRYLEANSRALLGLLASPHAKIVRQFPLGDDYRADFAFAHKNSGGNHLHLLELESPRVALFNRDDSFSGHFNHAVQQLHDWLQWCRTHQDFLLERLTALLEHLKSDNLYVTATLVMGRRANLATTPRQERFESRHQTTGITVRTYDGLAEQLENDGWAQLSSWSPPIYAYRRRSFAEIKPAKPKT